MNNMQYTPTDKSSEDIVYIMLNSIIKQDESLDDATYIMHAKHVKYVTSEPFNTNLKDLNEESK